MQYWKERNNDLKVVYPPSSFRLPDSWSNWNQEVLVFKEWRKPEYPEKNLSKPMGEPTTNKLYPHIASTPGFWTQSHVGGRRLLSELWHCAALAPRSLLLGGNLLVTLGWSSFLSTNKRFTFVASQYVIFSAVRLHILGQLQIIVV